MPEGFSGKLPIFPLTGSVFFPKTLLPLRIVDEPYHKLLEDVLEGERLIGIAFTSIGHKGSLNVHRIGTIGNIAFAEKQPDGSSQVVVSGIERFGIDSLLLGKEYYVADVHLLPEELPSKDDPVMLAQLHRLVEMIRESNVFDLGDYNIPSSGAALGFQYQSLINAFCTIATEPPERKQKWLEADCVVERYRRVIPVLEKIIILTNLLDKLGHLAPDKEGALLN